MDSTPPPARRTVTLFYAVRHIGGAQLLFARMGQALAALGHPVELVDFEDGFLRVWFEKHGVPHRHVAWAQGRTVRASPGSVLLLAAGELPVAARVFFGSDCDVFLWAIHPHNFLAYAPVPQLLTRLPLRVMGRVFRWIFPGAHRRLRALGRLLADTGGVGFMDGPNLAIPRSVGVFPASMAPGFLPIPFTLAEGAIPQVIHGGKGLRFLCLGRLDRDKWHAVRLALDAAALLAKARGVEVVFHLVGDGDRMTAARAYSAPGVKVILHGIVHGPALSRLVADGVDLGFAMGTSALELAARGLPTVLLDWPRSRVSANGYPFRWLFDTCEMSLGDPLSLGFRGMRQNLGAMVDDLSRPGRAVELGTACRDYVISHHSTELIARQLGEALTQCRTPLSSIELILNGNRPCA